MFNSGKRGIRMAVEHPNHEQVKTREEYKKVKDQERSQTVVLRPKKQHLRARLIPVWLKLLLLIVSCAVFLMAGAMVGFSFVGNGKASEVFKVSTWTHIQDLIDKK